MSAISFESAAPLEAGDEDGVGAIGGLVIGLGISLLLWLLPVSAWLLLS